MSVLNALCGPLIIRGPLTFGPIEREEKRERREREKRREEAVQQCPYLLNKTALLKGRLEILSAKQEPSSSKQMFPLISGVCNYDCNTSD